MLKLKYFMNLIFYSEPIMKLQQAVPNEVLDRKACCLYYTLLPIFTSSEMIRYDMINPFKALDIVQTMRSLLKCLSF